MLKAPRSRTLWLAGVLLAAPAVLAPTPLLAQPLPTAAAQPGNARPAEVVRYESVGQLQLLALRGPTVVFFFASWCPNCKATIAELNARWGEVKPGLTLVIADYDQETDLKGRLGVTYQDTFVQVGPEAERIGIWNAGGIDGLNANTVGF